MADTVTIEKPVIEIPRLEGETNRAYSARVEYLTMGAQRSIEKLRQNHTKTIPHYKVWSSKYNWQEHARRYDDALAALAVQSHAEQYRRDLEEHRERYQKAGKDLYAVASGLLSQCARAIRGQVVEGKDGKVYTIPAIEITPAALSTAMRALTIAGDLEAHALRIADLLPRLDAGDSE